MDLVDLFGKTFTVEWEEKPSKIGNELNLYLILHQDGRATFRGRKGSIITKENPLSWRFAGDSIYVQGGPITLVADGKRQYIAREPMKYAIEKVPGGCLFKARNSQMRLFD